MKTMILKSCLVVNKASRRGGRGKLLELVKKGLSKLELAVSITESTVEVEEVIRQARENQVSAVVVIGGDGTVSHLLEHLADTRIALGLVPTGTANDLAGYLGIPTDPGKACEIIQQGFYRELDLLEVNGRLFVTAGGIGVVADTGIGVNRWKSRGGLLLKAIRFFGSKVYVLYSLALLLFSPHLVTEAEVLVDDRSLGKKRYIALFAHNQPSLGKVVVPCPDATSEDGLIDLCLMEERKGLRRWGAVWTVLLMSLGGSHRNRSEIELVRGRRVEIRVEGKKTFMADGEALLNASHFVLKARPKALKVLVPGDTLEKLQEAAVEA